MWNRFLFMCAFACLAAVGCGEDSTSSGDAGGDGDGTAGDGDGDGDGDSAGDGDGTTDSAVPMFTCDDSVQSVDSCNGTSCPALDQMSADRCQVNCCTAADVCGQKNTSAMAAQFGLGDCQEPAAADDRCPSVGPGVGCCLDSGLCGASFGGSPCFDISAQSGMAAPPCDGADAGVE